MLTGLGLVWLGVVLWAAQGYDVNDQWNRMAWGWTGVAGLLILVLGSRGAWAPAAWLGWIVYTLMVTTPRVAKVPRAQAWQRTGVPLVALVGGVLLWPSLHVDTRMILGGLALMGLPVTLWAGYSWAHPTGRYQWTWGGLGFYDESNVCPRAGQGNANHAQSVIVLSLAAACGLAVIASPWWLVPVPCYGVGIWLCRDHRGSWLTQGVVQAGVVLVVAGLWGGGR